MNQKVDVLSGSAAFCGWAAGIYHLEAAYAFQTCSMCSVLFSSGFSVCVKVDASDALKCEWMFTVFFFLTFFCHQHLTCLIFCSSPWRLCGPPPGPPSQFCPVVRSRLFSIRCLSSETCTKASTLAWRPGWASTVRLSPALLRRERWATQAFSWWWGTCFWKWWVLYCVACILCHGTIGNPLRNDGKERFSHGSTTREKSFSLRCRKEVTA